MYLVWDREALHDSLTKGVIIGKLKTESPSPTQRHYLLLIRKSDEGETYERVGVGFLPKDCIVLEAEGTDVEVC